jgi:hypothetical protein
LEAYLQGALHDATYSRTHRTHRFGQADRGWLEILQSALEQLGHRSWSYREGRERNYWVVETTAPFLSVRYQARTLVGTLEGLDYVRGYFDAEGGMPRNPPTGCICRSVSRTGAASRSSSPSWKVTASPAGGCTTPAGRSTRTTGGSTFSQDRSDDSCRT